MRCWHGGTPNISTSARALPSIHYMAPFLADDFSKLPKVLPYALWNKLTPHGQHIARHICARRGVKIRPKMRVFPGRQRVWTQQIPFFQQCTEAFTAVQVSQLKRGSRYYRSW